MDTSLVGLVFEPPDCPSGALGRDPDFEPGDVGAIADSIGPDATPDLVPRHRSLDDHQY